MASLLKRRMKQAQELKRIKERLQAKLPELNNRQIRRHRILYEDALLSELKEDGFIESSEYLSSLLTYQREMREKAGKDSHIWNKPLLKDKKELLLKLFNGLKATETALKNNQRHTEIDNIMSLAIFFVSDDDDNSWWWLGQQLFLQTLELAKNYSTDGDQRHALARFFYGRFLLRKLKHIHEAEANLRKCRELAAGRNWKVVDYMKTEVSNKSLYRECCFYLYKALLILVERFMNSDLALATRLCITAHKRAAEAQYIESEAECMYHIGLCYMKAEQYTEAISQFQKALMIYFSKNDKASICETRIRLASSFAKLESYTDAKYHLTQLLEFTKKYGLRYYEAQANKFIGELYLCNFMSNEAGSHLLKAIEIFHELDDYDNREQAKNMAAIAAGFQMMLQYRSLIQSCSKNQTDYIEPLMTMVGWKNTREQFYKVHDLSTESSTTQTTAEISYFDKIHGEASSNEEDAHELMITESPDGIASNNNSDSSISMISEDA